MWLVLMRFRRLMKYRLSLIHISSQPGKGYEVGSQTASPEKVKITGPKSLVNKIDKVNATVDVDGRTKDFSEEAELNIIDKNQDSLAGRMAYLTIDNTKVVVTTKFWKIRTGVNIGAYYVGAVSYTHLLIWRNI